MQCSLRSPTQCSDIHEISTNSSTCDYVVCVDGCHNDEGIINYLYFIYCQMPPNLIPLAMVILVSVCVCVYVRHCVCTVRACVYIARVLMVHHLVSVTMFPHSTCVCLLSQYITVGLS